MTRALIVRSGYTFEGQYSNTAEVAEFTINGVIPTFIENTNRTLVLSYTFPRTDKLVTQQPVMGVTSPVGGQKASFDIEDSTEFTSVIDDWEPKPAVPWDPNTDPFDYDSTYTATVTLNANPGYTFRCAYRNDAEVAGFTVNGVAPKWISNNNYQLVMEYTFPTTKILILPQEITGVVNPVARETPSMNVDKDIYIGFTSEIIAWDPDNEIFGHPFGLFDGIYSVTIRLTALDGYTFSNVYMSTDEISGFTVNGIEPSWVSGTPEVLEIRITFPATEPCEHEWIIWTNDNIWQNHNISAHIRSCRFCPHTETAQHTLSPTWNLPSTATQHGRNCTVCTTFQDWQPHTWGAWGAWQNTNATQHTRSRTCTTCARPGSEVGNHSWGSWVNISASQHRRTCSLCLRREDASHTWGDWIIWGHSGTIWSADDFDKTYHYAYRHCTICGVMTSERALHEWYFSHIAHGFTYYWCSICGWTVPLY